jgi:Holliday junction resolvase-like predicted endonuclease
MNTAKKGAAAERRAIKILESAGYTASRSAASKGVFDVVAFNGAGLRLIQVKSGGSYASSAEREAMCMAPAPIGATKEIWRFPDRCREPLIEVL